MTEIMPTSSASFRGRPRGATGMDAEVIYPFESPSMNVRMKNAASPACNRMLK